MDDIDVSELWRNLPSYLANVQLGVRPKVTSPVRVTAEIVPPVVEEEQAAAARKCLRGGVIRLNHPFDPALAADEWAMNR